MKKIIAYCLLVSMFFCVIPVSAYTYEPPYDTPDISDRIWEQMPTPFSYDTLAKTTIAECNFDTASSTDVLSLASGKKYWSEADGAVKVNKTETGTAYNFVLSYTPAEGFTAGDYYAFSCKIKTEGVQGTSPKNIIACYSNTKWLTEAGQGKTLIGDNDWYTMVQYVEVPEGTASVRLSALCPQNLTGTVYFDDFKLYKLALDPLESVLRSPNYKGLIYGDGDSDIVLDVLVSENKGLHEFDNMALSVKLLNIHNESIYSSDADAVSEKMTFTFSSRGLAEGDYYLQTILKNKTTGEVISTKEHTLRKRSASYRPDSYVDENGHFIKGNEKQFFKRIYNYRSGDDTYYLESARFAAETGIDTVSNYGIWWAVGSQYDEALNYMREHGLTTHIAFNSYYYSDRSGNGGTMFIPTQEDTPKFFAEVVNDFKNDKVLEGYYLFDEPNPRLVGEEIRWNNQIMAELDINHPTFGVADKAFDVYGIYTKMADIIGVDPYPVTGKTDDAGNPTYDISKAGRAVRQMKESFPNRPVYYVLQGFHYASRGDLRSPNYAELRNMAWQAICEGAEGLDCYGYPDMVKDTTKTLAQWTSEMKTLMAEVEQYEDAILSDEPAPNYTVAGTNNWLNITLRRYNGKTYVFAVNNTFNSHQTMVNIEGLDPMSLSFEPLEVKQLVLEQEAYLSPEAELKYMDFSNGEKTFAVSVGEENTLYVGYGNGVINYTASITDGANLYIGNKKVPTTGKIAVNHCDGFSVTVLAADGKTKKTTYYNVIK